MKAVVYHGIGDIRLDTVPDPSIREATDVIIRVTASAICGTDLHFVRGTFPGMKPGTILGHEAVGVIEEVGRDIRNFRPGDRVVVPSTIACGSCSYCRCGYFSQCDEANPHGPQAGTAFFGGPESTGPFAGLQAEYARIPYAHVGLVKLPEEVSDEQAILISDIFPTGYFGARLAEVRAGDTVAVFGCGPVGQFAIMSAHLMKAGRVFAVDQIPDRLAKAQELGAETIDFSREDPVETLRRLTGGIGPDRAIDAVGVDAEHAINGPAHPDSAGQRRFDHEREEIAGNQIADESWRPGTAPSQALQWGVESLAKAGTLSVIGVYPPQLQSFPIGLAMGKNLTINMGNCNHRKYMPELVRLVRSGAVEPESVLSKQEQLISAVDAYHMFAEKKPGWLKVELESSSVIAT